MRNRIYALYTMKKSIFFTIDGLIASGIIIISILLISNFYIKEVEEENVGYASQDIVKVFSSLKVGDSGNEYVKSLISSGEITSINSSIIEQIGSFWAENEIDLARNLTKNVTEQIIPKNFGFSLLINGEEIYSRNLPVKRVLVSSRRTISGISKGSPTEGFTSRVLLSGIRSKRTNAYAYFGGYEGDGNLTKNLILPNNVISFNSSYLEVDAGGSFNLYINGFFSGSYVKGSSGGGNMLADKWNLSSAYLANFRAGENRIDINFTSGYSYISGGFMRVTYITSSFNDTQTSGYEKYRFPGISGLINLYSSFYAPNAPGSMNISLHFLSPYQMYLTIGNITVFESNGSKNELTVALNNSNLSSMLNYASLAQKTVPLRIGLRNVSLGKNTDAVLITDRSGSMGANCDVNVGCSLGVDCNGGIAGCQKTRLDVANQSNRKFIETILKGPENKVGLVGFGGNRYQLYCDFHDFSSDNRSLVSRLDNYVQYGSCHDTCISCGIYSATQLLIENERLHGFKEIIVNDTTVYGVGNPWSSSYNKTLFFNRNINKSKVVKARLTIFAWETDARLGFQQCVYFNDRYIGKVCDSDDPGMQKHTCSYYIKPEWLSDTSINNITLTAGNASGCFYTMNAAGWRFNDVKLNVWESPASTPITVHNISAGEVQLGDPPFQIMATSYINITVDPAKARSAILELEAIDANVNQSYYDCIYINGNYLARLDFQRWNFTDTWQKMLFEVPAAWIKNGSNEINITGGTNDSAWFTGGGCNGVIRDNDEWRFRNLNLSVVSTAEPVSYDRSKSMLVMSDGDADISGIEGCSTCAPGEGAAEAIKKACEAHNLYGIGIYAVSFGNAGQGSINTLNATACCDDCSHFYTSNNVTELLNIYEKIANSMVKIGFQTQTVNVSGPIMDKTILYPDSYLQFNYTPLAEMFNRVPLAYESERFGNNISNGTIEIPQNLSIVDARVTSYSGDSWTDKLVVNGNTVYKLSDYGNSYQSLGDPFSVNIPAGYMNNGNNSITISTGINATNSTGGSSDDRAIYTLSLNAFSGYSNVAATADGCAWNVAFEDGTFSTIKIPPGYSGTGTCSYTPLTWASGDFDQNDALDSAVYQLFTNIDIDKDGKLDVIIDENSFNVNTLTISKIPSLWGPAIIEIRVWE